MENYNIKKENHSSSLWSGMIILAVGIVFFLRSFGLNIPHWVISWPAFLIVIGLFVGFRRNFQGGGWLIMVLIGGYFIMEDITEYDFSKYYFAVGFIIVGLYLILRPKRNREKRWEAFDKIKGKKEDFSGEGMGYDQPAVDENDVIESINVFGGAHQKVYSKNFKGGEVVAVFGGCEINLTQADFKDVVTIEVVAIFGGTKIIIPPTWEVKSEIVAIFGGLDDKRTIVPFDTNAERKVLVIKGVALFGGVDIRNF